MDETIFSEFSDEFTETLLAFCDAPAPAAAAVAELERRLLEHQAEILHPAQPEPVRKGWNPFPLRRWQYAVIVLLVALGSALIAIGPQRVLAQVQLWFSYLPGVGFINAEQTRVLAAPLDARQGNTTLQVQQVIAGTDKTLVVVTLRSTPQEITLDTEWAGQVRLILPNGQSLASQRSSQQNEAGQLSAEIEFPPLPAGIDRVTLEMPKLPIATNIPQQFWSVVLPLQGVHLAVAPYNPKNVQATNQGVTVRLLQVAQSAQETGLLIQVDWRDSSWDYQGSGAQLRDNRGRVYQRLAPLPGSNTPYTGIPRAETTAQELLRFPALDPGAQQVTLILDTIAFEVHSQAQFQFDPGNHPSIGQTWSFAGDPAMRLNIAGIQAQVVQASLTSAPASDQVTVSNPPEATMLPQPTALPAFACRLEFIVQANPATNVQLFTGPPRLVGEKGGPSGASSTGDNNRTTAFLDLPKIPTAPLTIQLNDSSLLLKGGWQLGWDVP